jgi:hypothetical protein
MLFFSKIKKSKIKNIWKKNQNVKEENEGPKCFFSCSGIKQLRKKTKIYTYNWMVILHKKKG